MKLLFATDGSDCAMHAARTLATMQTAAPSQLSVLAVSYAPSNVQRDSVRPWYTEYRKHEDARVQAHFDLLSDVLREVSDSVHMQQVQGDPTHQILSCARETDVDLIVLGAKGHSAIGRILLGSVSDAVATHADCSVLVIRPDSRVAKKSAADGQTASDLRKIVLAYDGSPQADATADQLLQFQWPTNACTEVVAVIPQFDPFGQEYEFQHQLEEDSSTLQEQMEVLKTKLVPTFRDVESKLLRARHVGESIVVEAADSHADIVFLGDSAHSPLENLILGSTAKYILRHANCSVCVVRKKKQAPC